MYRQSWRRWIETSICGLDEIAAGLQQYFTSVNARQLANHARPARAREGRNPIRCGP